MIIPSDPKRKETKIKYVLDTCLESQQERYNNYSNRRRYFLFGTGDDRGLRVLYNRLQAHTDLVSSFLYAADHAEFNVSPPRNSPDAIVQQMLAVEEDWNDEFRDCGLAYQFAVALLWSLIYDSMMIKIGWNSGREELTSTIVPPYNFGVYDESEPDLNSQQAFAHTYTIHAEEAQERMKRAGLGHRIGELRSAEGEEKSPLPEPLQLMIANNLRHSVTDPVVGRLNRDYTTRVRYTAQYDTTRVRLNDVWVWDDDALDEDGEANGDYRMFRVLDNGIILEDSKESIDARTKAGLRRHAKRVDERSLRWTTTNDYLPGEHPFVHVRPFELYDYFWGECHTERLIPLQDWTSQRLDEIHEILEMQVDPPKVFSGFLGLSDEKAEALHGPGTWVTDMQPGAKVESLAPSMPEDLFAEVEAIGGMFQEASGLTPTVTGKGEAGVRGGGHAKQLATTGSARIKKTAVGLEPTLVELGDKCLKLRRIHDTRQLFTDSKMAFSLSQLAGHWRMRVAGHSHSPLFADEGRETAQILLKAQAIDREQFLRLMHPPGMSNMIFALRKRLQTERQLMQTHPELLQRSGGGKGKGSSPLAAAA